MGQAFRADAKAEGDLVVVGGWESLGGRAPRQARWFALQLAKATAPWAFSRREPFRTIASVELFASLICIMVFSSAWPADAAGNMVLTGVTDNRGNTFAISRLMSSKFPLVVVLA